MRSARSVGGEAGGGAYVGQPGATGTRRLNGALFDGPGTSTGEAVPAGRVGPEAGARRQQTSGAGSAEWQESAAWMDTGQQSCVSGPAACVIWQNEPIDAHSTLTTIVSAATRRRHTTIRVRALHESCHMPIPVGVGRCADVAREVWGIYRNRARTSGSITVRASIPPLLTSATPRFFSGTNATIAYQ